MPTTTPNLGLKKPTVGADADQWGDLINETIDILDAQVVTPTSTTALLNKALVSPIILDGYTEEVFSITDGPTVVLSPLNGSIQTWTLGANRSPTFNAGWGTGQNITLMIDDGASFAITWPAVNWKTNSGGAPTLNTVGFTVIQIWKVGTLFYGARVGDA